MPSTIESEPFSRFLICSQLVITSETVSASTSPKMCGCRRTSFSWIPRATSAIVNAPASRASTEWNTTW